MLWGINRGKNNSPVLRGDDEPEIFSCQLYFFPKELLFNVSCGKAETGGRDKKKKWMWNTGREREDRKESLVNEFWILTSQCTHVFVSFHTHTHRPFIQLNEQDSFFSLLCAVHLKGNRPLAQTFWNTLSLFRLWAPRNHDNNVSSLISFWIF